MPYIPKTDRTKLDPAIDALAKCIIETASKENYDAAFAGLLNYSMTRLTLSVIKQRFGKYRYWMIATVVGVFKNAGDEFYRRVGVPYEDKKIATDGDVDFYEEFQRDLKS